VSEDFDRRRVILEKIAETEEKAEKLLSFIRKSIRDYLITVKGYTEEDIEEDMVFEISVDGKRENTSVDYLINLTGKRFIAIKCSPGALESRERHLVAFARVVDSCQIPYVVVTDGTRARLLDATTGKLLAEELHSIPSRDQAQQMLHTAKFMACPAERIDREKRILLAFEAIECTKEACE
jgi:Type I restriction enzyme R protein N terminus (HSDR_N)